MILTYYWAGTQPNLWQFQVPRRQGRLRVARHRPVRRRGLRRPAAAAGGPLREDGGSLLGSLPGGKGSY